MAATASGRREVLASLVAMSPLLVLGRPGAADAKDSSDFVTTTSGLKYSDIR